MPIDARRSHLFVYPDFEPLPVADQTLVRNIDNGFRLQCGAGRWHQKRAARAAEDIDHRDHFLHTRAGDLAQHVEPRWVACLAVIRATLTESFEEFLGDQTAAFVRQLIKRFVSMARERV